MKKILMPLLFAATVLFSAATFAEEASVHHIVLFDLKDDVTAEQIDEMITVGEALIADIPGVLEVSINRKARDDRDVHVKDYDVAMYVRWEDNDTGDVYAPHLLHQTFIKLYKSYIDGMKVIDFYGN